MARANAAYYATRDPFADFTTSPEISQAFGELLGAWCAVVWDQLRRPAPVRLVELGPGRGTLMQDARRAMARVAPAFHAAASIHLVETSAVLRGRQSERVPDAVWHDRVDEVPAGPMILLANEFLDALPIRQFLRTETGWAERHVAGRAFATAPCPAPPQAARWTANPGDIREVNEPAEAVIGKVARRIVRDGGAALFLDYGPAESGPGDSLQAIREGRHADPLLSPGTADLTAHIDFAALATVGRDAGAAVYGPLAQGRFLVALGLLQRAFALARTQPPWKGAATVQAARRLVEPHRMGGLFKALALCQPGIPTLPGFEP